ncbi:MAG: NAD-dependent epimerase/dehydratase family protein [Phycisphaerae bacterium]|nr:NAD-dependent epimerase/dehydratase family protein [Gemmatimonadaceae bacterium]
MTGSSGFIGSHVVDALLAMGAEVRALVRPMSSNLRRPAGVSYCTADVLQGDEVLNSPIWNGATHVFHLAGVTTARTLSEFRAGNVTPLKHVLAAVERRLPNVNRVVVVSSQAAGGPAVSATQPADGTNSVAPVEWYGQSKLEAELLALTFVARLPVSIVRLSSVYGPRDRDFLAAFRQAVRPVALYATPPDHRIELAYVSDVVRALSAVAVNDVAIGKRYTVTGLASVSWRELYAEVARAAAVRTRNLTVPMTIMRTAARAGDVLGIVTQRTPLINSQKLTLGRQPFWLCDGSAIRRDLQWHPQVSLQAGVRDTYVWYVAARLLHRNRTPRDISHSVGQDSAH